MDWEQDFFCGQRHLHDICGVECHDICATGCGEAELTVDFEERRCDISCMCFVCSCAYADMSGNRPTGERHSLCICSKNIEKLVCTVFSVTRKILNSIHSTRLQQTEDFNSARAVYPTHAMQDAITYGDVYK